ncbi:MAG: M56 family metallopeptidase, partial [Verrucomicrobia bacterium]|nr:M56 family metallopeptidase [Verrucomicrobiota bacterium]
METNSMLTSIFGCVLKSSWQAAALVCLVLIVQGILGRNLSARWRYGLWFLVLVRLLVPVLPESAFSIYNLAKTSASSASGRERPAFELLTRGNERKAVSELSAVSQMPLFPEASAPLPQPKKSVRLWTWLIGLWVSGATMLAGCFAWQIVRFNRRVRRYGCLDDARVHSILEEAKLSVGLKTAVQLVETCETPVPAMFGLIRPRLLLPADFRKDYSEHELRLVFLHELTHLKRRDHVVNWMMLVLSTIHWFNPLVWLAFGRMRADRELACDEQVLTVSPDHQNKSYGQMLIKLLEGLPQPARLPGLIGIVENTHQLKRRITMIAKFKRPARWSALLALPVIALGFITLTDAQTKTERPDKEVIAEIEKLSGKVTYDETRADRPVIGVDFFINDEDWWKSKVPRLKVTDNMLKRLEALKELEDLDLTDAQISDEGLACLQGLTRLRKLSLLSTKITGSGLRHGFGRTGGRVVTLKHFQLFAGHF